MTPPIEALYERIVGHYAPWAEGMERFSAQAEGPFWLKFCVHVEKVCLGVGFNMI